MVIVLGQGYAITSATPLQSGNSGSPGVAQIGSPKLGLPTNLSVGVKVSATTTITLSISYDGVNWIPATIRNSSAAATMSLTGASAGVLDITPAPYVQVASNASVTITAWAYTS